MYERAWAETVFDNFYTKHVLSVREVNRVYNISIDALIRTIQDGSDRWRGYKSLVKHVEEAVSGYWKHFHTYKGVREKYLTFDKYLSVQLKRRSFPAPIDLVDTEVQQDLFL